MKKKKKISVQTIIEVMIRAVFFIIYPALFSTAFTGIKLIVEQITQRASPVSYTHLESKPPCYSCRFLPDRESEGRCYYEYSNFSYEVI